MAKVSSNRVAVNQARRLDTFAKQIREMCWEWGDIDGYLENALEELAGHLDTTAGELRESVEVNRDKNSNED